MSWLRFGGLDRFSPFTRSPPQGSTTVSDADFSYITTEDLQRHVAQDKTTSGAPESEAPRDTDSVLLKDRRNEYTVHFPVYSMSNGDLRIKTLREAAAKRMNIDAKKVKLVYKGRILKDDRLQCRAEGLRSGSEILCSNEDSEFSSDFDDSDEETSTKKKRNRNRNKKKRNNKQDSDEAPGLDVPSTQSRGPSTGTSTPLTAKDKINALRATLQSYDQDVQAFLDRPPAEASKREFDRKKISETLLTQVLLKTDAIETEGDPTARASRKELVRDVQNVLKELDEAHGGQSIG